MVQNTRYWGSCIKNYDLCRKNIKCIKNACYFYIKVCNELRQKTKQICYGMLYGMGPVTLSETLDITIDEAHKLMTEFKNTFSGVNKFFNDCVTQCRTMGLVKTLSGRIRHLPDITSDVPKIKCWFLLLLVSYFLYF